MAFYKSIWLFAASQDDEFAIWPQYGPIMAILWLFYGYVHLAVVPRRRLRRGVRLFGAEVVAALLSGGSPA